MLNQNPNTFTFNGRSSDEFGIRIERKPDLNRSGRKFKSDSVVGRNGNIYQLQDAWDEVVVSYNIYAGGRNKGDAVPAFTDIMEWLNSADDYAVLTDSYDPTHYRMAVFVDAVDIKSQWHTIGEATIKFRCRPQRYLTQGTNQMAKMTAGTYSANGGTVVVDANGKAMLSGTTTSGGSIAIIPLENSITITQEMVDNDTYLYLNNYGLNFDTIIYFEDNSSVKAVTAYAFESNTSVKISQSAVGKTITRVKIYLAVNRNASGTFMPKLQSESSVISVADGDTVTNPTNHTALPIITLTGSQVIPNLLDLEKSYTYTVDGSGYTQWSDQFLDNTAFYGVDSYQGVVRSIGYYTQATASSRGGTITTKNNSTGTLTFTSWLNMGADVGVGRGITLTPNSDYTISCSASASTSRIQVIFFNSESPQSINSVAEKSRNGAGTLTLSFHVPTVCKNALIMFYQTDGTSGTFSNIMLNTGTTAAQFAAYGGETTDSFSVNDVTLSFTHSGFSTAVIDCEHENFTVDGVNANNKATLVDQYGNLSDEYLQLTKGGNNVSYTANISSVSVVPHFWEL